MSFSLDPIDIVTDPIPAHEYKAEEDPRLYKSLKTQRGPLRDDWIEEYNNNPGKTPIMCAYKLCKVEFRYWGMQSKIERFIHDVGACQQVTTHHLRGIGSHLAILLKHANVFHQGEHKNGHCGGLNHFWHRSHVQRGHSFIKLAYAQNMKRTFF